MASNEKPDLIAVLDQSCAELESIAVLIGSYFQALLRQDFDRTEALKLARDYQLELFDSRDDE